MRHEHPLTGEVLEPGARASDTGPAGPGASRAARGPSRSAPGAEGLAGSSLTQDEVELLRRADLAAKWMDSRFRLPLTEWRFGLDGLLGLLPGVGDGAGMLVSGYVAWTAWQAGMPLSLVLRMAGNILLDAVLDFGFKANRRNAALLRAHLERRTAGLA